jgi:arginine decarboxylase
MDYIKTGNRIPHEFFVTQGRGESDLSSKVGSFHIALHEAGIAQANIMKYSSVLPAEAVEAPFKKMHHGEVAEVIAAQANGRAGERITAGLAYAWLYDKKTGLKGGGLVCEYEGSGNEKQAESALREGLREIYENGFSQDYVLKDTSLITDSFIPQKKFGTVLIALCFTSFLIPIVS